jgi:hypothetical protein
VSPSELEGKYLDTERQLRTLQSQAEAEGTAATGGSNPYTIKELRKAWTRGHVAAKASRAQPPKPVAVAK